MSLWLTKIRNNQAEIIAAIDYYESEIINARSEISLRGSIEAHSRDMPSHVESRFYQLQELESILEYLNIELKKMKSHKFKNFLERYNRQLSSRDAEKYIDGEQDIVDMQHIINEFALVRNKMLGIIKALEAKQFQINNLVKLRAAGLDDLSY